jgi:ligand-binding SRPBCC domain-containing protein
MSYTQIIREQLVKTNIDDLWNFMSSPKNLQKITPQNMGFIITSNNKEEIMYPGMIISYKVTPILNIPLTWITEITQVKDKKFFVDEQRVGPYKMWHHEHIFKVQDNGVLMKDIITYIPPFGILGKVANDLFINKRVKEIFDFRSKVLEEIYNTSNKD